MGQDLVDSFDVIREQKRKALVDRRGIVGLLLLNALLISPLVVYTITVIPRDGVDNVFLFNCLITILWLGVVLMSFRRPFIAHLVLAPFYLTTIADLFLVNAFETRLSSSYASVMITDYVEWKDFLGTYFVQVLILGLPFLVLFVFGVANVRKVEFRFPKKFRNAAIGLLLIAYAFVIGRQMAVAEMSLGDAALDVALHDFSCPVGGMVQLGIATGMQIDTGKQVAGRHSFTFEASKDFSEPEEVYVIIIGESSRADHWSATGYHRNTTPRLSALNNVIFFGDLVSTASLTSYAVPSMLSLASISNWDSVLQQRSIVSAFNEVGFDSYWFSTQEVSHWSGVVHHIAAEAKNIRYHTRAHDVVLLDDMKTVLRSPNRSKKMLFILHSKGSHFEFSQRYPPEFAKFDVDRPTRVESIVNAYDNSILYTDFFLSEAIKIIDSLNCYSMVFYSSDHGEGLLDDERELLGHGFNNQYDLRTIAMLWYSEEMAGKFPEKIATSISAAKKPLSLESFSHSVLDITGINAKGLDLTKSVFNQRLRNLPRLVYVHGKAQPYSTLQFTTEPSP